MRNYWWPLMGESVTPQEREAMSQFILHAKRLTYGEEIKKFEALWAQWNQSPISLYVNSGTSADYLILAVSKYLHNWNANTEILVPAITWGTTISSVINLGLKPVFVDMDLTTLSMSVEDAKSKVTAQTGALFLTHCLGIPNDMDGLQAIARQHSLVVLEDCCESHGAQWKGEKVGNFSLASTFSFFWGHHMTTIEGGMVCTQDENFAQIARSMRNHGLTRDLTGQHKIDAKRPDLDERFTFLTPGFNFRGTETYARLGQMQLPRLDSFIAQRNRNHAAFLKIVQKYSAEISTFHCPEAGTISSYSLPFLFSNRQKKEKVMEFLESNGIETRPLISGNMARQPFVQKYLADHDLPAPALPNAEKIHHCAMYIGNSQFVEAEHLEKLDDLLAQCL